MKKIARNILTALSVFFFPVVAVAQISPVQITPQLLAPYSLQVSDYYAGIQPRMQVLVLNRDINQPTIQVKLKMTVESQNCRMRTKDNAATPTLTLTSGIPYYMTPQDLQAYFSAANLDFTGGYSEQEYVQTGRLPEGLYSFYFEAFELFTGNLVSNKGFALGWLTLTDPPLLNTPAKAEGVIPSNPQNIIFNWTPRHNTSPTAGYYTDYVFTLAEYNDLNLGPEASFTSSPPLFIDSVQTTTYLFGPGHPQLIAGKRYAWRVQAKAKDGAQQLAMFRNNGFSEVFWFTYQNNCPVPLGITATVQGLRSTIEWQNNPQHLEWKVEYREKNNPDAQWFNLGNTLPRVMLTDLKPGTQYEYRVGGSCEVGNFTYSALYSFSTAGSPVPPVANCGDSTLPLPGGGQTLQTLNAGDTIRAGSFTVHVGYATGTGSFTGTGYVIVPWLMNAKVEVRFTTITLSLDRKLLSGVIETTYDPTESGIDDIDEYVDIFTAGHGVGDVITGEVTADTTLTYNVQWPGGITRQLPPNYNSETGTGTGPIIITIQPQGGGATNSFEVEKLPTTIKDKDGNVYQVDKNGNVAKIGKAGGDALLKTMNTKVIDKDKAEVKFVDYPAKQVYAFDEWKEVYKKSNTFNKEYERIGDYYVSQKAIAPGQTDYLKAVVTITDPAIHTDSIQFVNGKGTIYTSTSLGSNAYEIAIVGGPEKDAQEIYAVYKQTSAKTLNLGKVKVSSYPKREYKVKLVPVNGAAINLNDISNVLKNVYSKANIFFNITVEDNFSNTSWDVTNNGLDVKGSGVFSDYTSEMKNLNASFRNSRNVSDNSFYLFVLSSASDSVIRGYMPRGKQIGYLFNNGNNQIGQTTAHEIGHGCFSLKHITEIGAFEQNDLSNNLMNYFDDIQISKYQWDLLHDPALVMTLFDSDGDGMSLSKPYIKCIKDQDLINSLANAFYDPNNKKVKLPAGAMPYAFFGFKETGYYGKLAGFKYNGRYYIYFLDPDDNMSFAGFYAPIDDSNDKIYLEAANGTSRLVLIDENNSINGKTLADCECNVYYSVFEPKKQKKIDGAVTGKIKPENKQEREIVKVCTRAYYSPHELMVQAADGTSTWGEKLVKQLNYNLQLNKDADIKFGADLHIVGDKSIKYIEPGLDYKGNTVLRKKYTWDELNRKLAYLELTTGYQLHMRIIANWCTFLQDDADQFAKDVFDNSNIDKEFGIYCMVMINDRLNFDEIGAYTFGIAFGASVKESDKQIVRNFIKATPGVVAYELPYSIIQVYKEIPKSRLVYTYQISKPTQADINDRSNRISSSQTYPPLTGKIKLTVQKVSAEKGEAIGTEYIIMNEDFTSTIGQVVSSQFELKEWKVEEYGLPVAKILGTKKADWNYYYWDGGKDNQQSPIIKNAAPTVGACNFTLNKSCADVLIDNIFTIATLVTAPSARLSALVISSALIYYGYNGEWDEFGSYLAALGVPVAFQAVKGIVTTGYRVIKFTGNRLVSIFNDYRVALEFRNVVSSGPTREAIEQLLSKQLNTGVEEYIISNPATRNYYIAFERGQTSSVANKVVVGYLDEAGGNKKIVITGYAENTNFIIESIDEFQLRKLADDVVKQSQGIKSWMAQGAKYSDNISSREAKNFITDKLEKFKRAKSFMKEKTGQQYNESTDLHFSDQTDSHLKGIDFDRNVQISQKREFYAWVLEKNVIKDASGNPIGIKQGELGSYFTNESANPNFIGINPEGRYKFKITLNSDADVLESFTTDIKAWDAPGIFYKGGDIQYFNPQIRTMNFNVQYIAKYE
ncbi:MAG TPA: fibronectin type III domain-containing protein [Chitinophagaceae bacterium]